MQGRRLRAVSLSCAAALALCGSGCDPDGPFVDVGPALDAAPDGYAAPDGAAMDAPVAVDGAPLDAAPDGTMADAGADAAPCLCVERACHVSFCEDAVCRYEPLDGVACGEGVCHAGACEPHRCGDGVRARTGAAREGCDDGNTEDGDGCDEVCVPTPLAVAHETEAVAFEDLAVVAPPGALVAVWIEQTRAIAQRHVRLWWRTQRAGAFESSVRTLRTGFDVLGVEAARSGPDEVVVAVQTVAGIELFVVGASDIDSVRSTGDADDREVALAGTETGHVVAWRRRNTVWLRERTRFVSADQLVASDAVGEVAVGTRRDPMSRRGAVVYESETGLRRRSFVDGVPTSEARALGSDATTPRASASSDGVAYGYTEHADDFEGDVRVQFEGRHTVAATGAREVLLELAPFEDGFVALYGEGAFEWPNIAFDDAAFLPPEVDDLRALFTHATTGHHAALAASGDGVVAGLFARIDDSPHRQLVLYSLPGT